MDLLISYMYSIYKMNKLLPVALLTQMKQPIFQPVSNLLKCIFLCKSKNYKVRILCSLWQESVSLARMTLCMWRSSQLYLRVDFLLLMLRQVIYCCTLSEIQIPIPQFSWTDVSPQIIPPFILYSGRFWEAWESIPA